MSGGATINVGYPVPLTRLNPWYPGQMGVPGGWTETGLRTHCTGAIFYVDPNYPGVSDGRDGTDPNDPLQTVQAAIDRCVSYHGDVIVVMHNARHEYASPAEGYRTALSESVTLDKAGVRLIGISASTVGVPWFTPLTGGTAIHITQMDCIIEGFLFRGFTGVGAGGTAIIPDWTGSNFGENATIRNNHFADDLQIGIDLQYAWYCDIHNNYFDGCAIGIQNNQVAAAAEGPCAFGEIHHNWFRDCGTCALQLDGAGALEGGTRMHIYENDIYNVTAATPAAATDEGIVLTNGVRNLVHHNTLSCPLPPAGAGDYNDFCSEGGTDDAWVQNFCMNGPTTTNPT